MSITRLTIGLFIFLIGVTQSCTVANAGVVSQAETNEALLNAACTDKYAKAEKALVSGADVNSKDKSGRTALAWAVSHANLNMMRLLVDKGADIHFRGKDEATLLHIAVSPVVPPPCLNPSEVQPSIPLATRLEISSYLLSQKVDPNIEDENGAIPLHYAAALVGDEKTLEQLIQVFIDAKSDISHKNKFGYIPADMAKDEKIKTMLKPRN